MMFHTSVAIMLLFYPLCRINIQKVSYKLFIVACLIIGFIGRPFFSFLTNIVGKYQGYLDTVYFNSDHRLAVWLTLIIDICFMSLFLGTDTYEDDISVHSADGRVKTWNIYFLDILHSAIIMTVGLDLIGLSNNIMSRVSVYSRVFMIILIPFSISHIKLKKSLFGIKAIVIVLLFLQYWVVLYFRPNWSSVIPYSFYAF